MVYRAADFCRFVMGALLRFETSVTANRMNRHIVILVFIGALVSTSVQAAANIDAGRQKAAVCAACHGVDGNSTNPEWPKLAGQHEQYLYKQLVDFKQKKRENPLMTGPVAELSDQDMRDLAAYYASQKGTPGSTSADQLELGQLVYRGGNLKTQLAACIACHGPAGSGNPAAKFPKLSGQHAKYVAQQLLNYRDGTRHNDPAGMMRNVANKMTTAEIEAVSQYIAGLH